MLVCLCTKHPLNIFFDAGQFAALPSLVDQNELAIANGRIQASFFAASIVGPLLAGGLLLVLPVPALLFVDAGSFVVSAALLSLIVSTFNVAVKREQKSIWHDVAEGLTAQNPDERAKAAAELWSTLSEPGEPLESVVPRLPESLDALMKLNSNWMGARFDVHESEGFIPLSKNLDAIRSAALPRTGGFESVTIAGRPEPQERLSIRACGASPPAA